jgi:hypothetical protein
MGGSLEARNKAAPLGRSFVDAGALPPSRPQQPPAAHGRDPEASGSRARSARAGRIMNERFFDLLDEVPRTPTSLLVQDDRGELRSFPIRTAAKAFELRAHGSRGRPRFPRLSRAQSFTAILGHILEREERDAES